MHYLMFVEKKKPKVEEKLVNAADIFGSGSVKRTARQNEKKVNLIRHFVLHVIEGDSILNGAISSRVLNFTMTQTLIKC